MRIQYFTRAFILVQLIAVPAALFAQLPAIEKIREQFFNMKNVNDGSLNLYYRLKPLDLTHNAILLAYRGAASAASAGSVSGVYKKLHYFSDGKTEIEEAVKLQPANAEIHFLRLATQLNAPGFLGYNKDITNDKALIINTMTTVTGTEPNAYLYTRIAVFLLNSTALTSGERERINQLIVKFKTK